MYESAVLGLIVEGFPALEGQVEAAAVHQRHLQVLPQLNDPWQQSLQRSMGCDTLDMQVMALQVHVQVLMCRQILCQSSCQNVWPAARRDRRASKDFRGCTTEGDIRALILADCH